MLASKLAKLVEQVFKGDLSLLDVKELLPAKIYIYFIKMYNIAVSSKDARNRMVASKSIVDRYKALGDWYTNHAKMKALCDNISRASSGLTATFQNRASLHRALHAAELMKKDLMEKTAEWDNARWIGSRELEQRNALNKKIPILKKRLEQVEKDMDIIQVQLNKFYEDKRKIQNEKAQQLKQWKIADEAKYDMEIKKGIEQGDELVIASLLNIL